MAISQRAADAQKAPVGLQGSHPLAAAVGPLQPVKELRASTVSTRR